MLLCASRHTWPIEEEYSRTKLDHSFHVALSHFLTTDTCNSALCCIDGSKTCTLKEDGRVRLVSDLDMDCRGSTNGMLRQSHRTGGKLFDMRTHSCQQAERPMEDVDYVHCLQLFPDVRYPIYPMVMEKGS